jgi:putative ABC transport system permease protein
MTFRNYLTPSEKIVEGEPFTHNQMNSALAPISLEKRWSQRMGIKLRDKLTFDVQGVEVDGEVVNLREVKWTDFYPNFFVTMAPGYIDEAPKTYLAVSKFGLKNLKNEFQRSSIEKFPNISFIDVEEAILKLTVIFEKSQLAIKLISFLSVLIGLIIFYAISHDQIYRRVFDLALLKTLGMSPTQIRIQLLLEFGFFFFFSTTLGILFGWVFSQVIGKEIFKLSLSLNVFSLTQSFIFLMMLCLVTIFLSSIHVLKTKPKDLLTEG